MLDLQNCKSLCITETYQICILYTTVHEGGHSQGGHSQGRGESGGDVVMKVTGKTATQSNGSLNLEVHFSRLLTALTSPLLDKE